jgi:hypothetical protein
LEIARIEATLDVSLLPDDSCSVLWLVPGEQDELSEAMTLVAGRLGMARWGFLGRWEHTKVLDARSADLAACSRLTGDYRYGETLMKADLLALATPAQNWFWSQFAARVRPHQICAALVPPGSPMPAAWSYAGLHLVLTAAAVQARPGGSHSYTLLALEQAFLAEALAIGGVAVTRLRADLLGPGIALTAAPPLIDEISAEFRSRPSVDPLLVSRSVQISGNW